MTDDSNLFTGRQLREIEDSISYVLEGCIVRDALNAIVGPAGGGKTALLHSMASKISRGDPWLDRKTKKSRVLVIDYENPRSRLADECRKLNLDDITFWTSFSQEPPVKIDGPYWEQFKNLPFDLIAVDGHRASMQGDENSSRDTALALTRWRQIANEGKTLVLLHHTTKANEKAFRGSQAFIDQLDHPLYFHPVRDEGDDRPVDTLDYGDALFFFGTMSKTRFSPSRMYLKRAGDYTFALAQDPVEQRLSDAAQIIANESLIQSIFVDRIRENLKIGKAAAYALLKLGAARGLWRIIRGEGKNSKLYQLPPVSQSSPIKEEEIFGKQKSGSFSNILDDDATEIDEIPANTEFASFPGGVWETGKQEDSAVTWEEELSRLRTREAVGGGR
jgi:hypothetical protein